MTVGMFDSLYDTNGAEWQTKAFGRTLATYEIGDSLTAAHVTCQVEILGGNHHLDYVDSYATIREGILASINDKRDESLPLLGYGGTWAASKGE